jgi:hypothetical protein
MKRKAASSGCGLARPYLPTSNARSPRCSLWHAHLQQRPTGKSADGHTAIRRAALYAAPLVALALLAAACSSSSSAAAAGGGSPSNSASASAVAYSACMRSHGVPDYPDPEADGNLPKGNAQAFGVSDSHYRTAERACQYLLPSSNTTFAASLTQCLENGDCPPAVVQRALTEGKKFARCMRNRGVPNWPDPTVDSMGRPSFQPPGLRWFAEYQPFTPVINAVRALLLASYLWARRLYDRDPGSA